MKETAAALWSRAQDALESASVLIGVDPDSAASRAYYAAFYAVSALFALEGRSFNKHTALESAVHRDLVRTGKWPGSSCFPQTSPGIGDRPLRRYAESYCEFGTGFYGE